MTQLHHVLTIITMEESNYLITPISKTSVYFNSRAHFFFFFFWHSTIEVTLFCLFFRDQGHRINSMQRASVSESPCPPLTLRLALSASHTQTRRYKLWEHHIAISLPAGASCRRPLRDLTITLAHKLRES